LIWPRRKTGSTDGPKPARPLDDRQAIILSRPGGASIPRPPGRFSFSMIRLHRRFYPDRMSQRVAIVMFAIVVILAIYAVVQRLV
jgi:hypothetical protein